MSKEERKVPELRFKGFHDDWEHRKLEQISDKVTEKNKQEIFKEVLTNSAEFGIVSQESYFDKEIANVKNISGYYIVRPNDFVYNPRISNFAPVGPIKRNTLFITGIMSPLYYVFRTKNISTTYLQKYFESTHWHRFMYMNGDSGARSDRFAIKDTTFNEMPIPYPVFEEQKSIANFISKLDKIITLHQRKINILNKMKKDFLKKNFVDKGKSYPELRFVNFTEKWEDKKLKDLGEINSGIGFPEKEQRGQEGFPFYKVSDMNTHGNEREMHKANNYIDEKQLKENRWKLVESVPAVIFAKVGAALLLNRKRLINEPFLLDNNTMYFSFKDNLDVEFGFSLFETIYLPRYAQVGALPSFNASDIKNIKVSIPIEEEQIKIGKYFKKLDKIIMLNERKLELLKKYKQVYLNKIFI